MNQGELFTAVPPIDPHREPVRVPFQRGSVSSQSGAASQSLDLWTQKQQDLLAMCSNGQPLTRNQLAFFLLWPLSSVCSILNSVRGQLEMVGYETITWDDGKTTTREQFQRRRR